jgi:hypothetical protein
MGNKAEKDGRVSHLLRLEAPIHNDKPTIMKKLLALTLLAAAACAHAQIQIAPIAGSISINKPGVYGRIDIGQQPPPPPVQLVYPQPVVVEPTPVAVYQRPVYLYVPPAHAHDWKHYCGRYAACGQPVYFVQDRWVRERYDVYARDHHDRDDYRDHDRHHERDHDHDHDHDHDDDHGHGHAYGHDR